MENKREGGARTFVGTGVYKGGARLGIYRWEGEGGRLRGGAPFPRGGGQGGGAPPPNVAAPSTWSARQGGEVPPTWASRPMWLPLNRPCLYGIPMASITIPCGGLLVNIGALLNYS